MRLPVRLSIALLALAPACAQAQVQPHRAEYALRLGIAANAPRIGTAVQDLSQDCSGWHIKRDIRSEIALTPSWKMNLSSRMDAEESRGGGAFRFDTLQVQNGSRRETTGKVARHGRDLTADISAAGAAPRQFGLPALTLMPVAAIGHLVERLRGKATSFPALMFDAEVIGDAFLIEVNEQERSLLRAARPADRPVAVPARTSWPVSMAFRRGRQQDQKPLFTVGALVFENGVLDRLTVETGLVAVTADLQALEMRPSPSCPRA